MSDLSDWNRGKTNSNAIEILFDPERAPREQIEAAIASVKPRKCEHHPHESLPVDTTATIRAALRHEYPYDDEPRRAEFVSVHERCSKCPYSEVAVGVSVEQCPAYFMRFRGGQIATLDEKNKPLPQILANVALEPDHSARDQFQAWLANTETFHCKVSDEPLPRCAARMTPPFEKWTIEPEFAACPSCALERLGISPDEAYASFEDFTLEPAEIRKHWETCRTFATNPVGVLLLLGNCGTGKTYLSIACLRERLKAGDTDLRFIKHRDFIDKHRRSLRAVPFGQEAPPSPFTSCSKIGLLLYDEIVAPTDGYAYEEVLLDLFEKRIGHFKPSIITANLSRNELETALGTRLFDRLCRAAYAVLEFGFESRRRLHNAEYLERSRVSRDRRRH